MSEEIRTLVLDGITYRTDGEPELVHHGDGRIEIRQRVHPPTEHVEIHFSSPSTAAERGEEGTARAARRWTPEEAARVERAIEDVARRTEGTFTTADVWAELGEGFPVTKGIASKMTAAARAGIIVNTGKTVFLDHPRHAHAHGQRLALWRRADR
jgi:hypothetical protein